MWITHSLLTWPQPAALPIQAAAVLVRQGYERVHRHGRSEAPQATVPLRRPRLVTNALSQKGVVDHGCLAQNIRTI